MLQLVRVSQHLNFFHIFFLRPFYEDDALGDRGRELRRYMFAPSAACP